MGIQALTSVILVQCSGYMENSCIIIKISYVDNNLKSLPSTEGASQHAGVLQHAGALQCLLLRGGLSTVKVA